ACCDDAAERTITVVRGRSVRIAVPVEVAVVATRADEASAAAVGFASGIADAGVDASSVRRVHAPGAGVRTPLVVIVVPPTGISTAEQEVASLCAGDRAGGGRRA